MFYRGFRSGARWPQHSIRCARQQGTAPGRIPSQPFRTLRSPEMPNSHRATGCDKMRVQAKWAGAESNRRHQDFQSVCHRPRNGS